MIYIHDRYRPLPDTFFNRCFVNSTCFILDPLCHLWILFASSLLIFPAYTGILIIIYSPLFLVSVFMKYLILKTGNLSIEHRHHIPTPNICFGAKLRHFAPLCSLWAQGIFLIEYSYHFEFYNFKYLLHIIFEYIC